MHGLGTVAVPDFFSSVSKDHEYHWGTRPPNMVYARDSMEDQDKHNSMEDLRDTEQSTSSLDKDTKENNSWGHKIKKK